MHFPVAQAMIVGLFVLGMTGCQSGASWPWAKKDPAVSQPYPSGATPPASYSNQASSNVQLPSTTTQPYNVGNNYAPGAGAPASSAGLYPEAATAAATSYPTGGAHCGQRLRHLFGLCRGDRHVSGDGCCWHVSGDGLFEPQRLGCRAARRHVRQPGCTVRRGRLCSWRLWCNSSGLVVWGNGCLSADTIQLSLDGCCRLFATPRAVVCSARHKRSKRLCRCRRPGRANRRQPLLAI